jgi:phosphohistidine phosphatase
MNVYLVRHGDAVSANENSLRPLSQKGRQSIERTARLALDRKIQISIMYHSGILRAQESAEIFSELFAPPLGLEEHGGLLPEDDPAIVKAELEIVECSILLVSHLPYLNRLAALLVTGDPDRRVVDFLPATMVCCSRANGRWKIDCVFAAGKLIRS